MTYASDREFTDWVHNNLAVKIIYPEMKWEVQELNSRLGRNIDMKNAVDYMAISQRDGSLKIVTVQERFREKKYVNYSDFTIRYMRPENKHDDRRLSEFFKLDADYFIYGIIDSEKNNREAARGFIKYAVINLEVLRDLIDKGTVVIDTDLKEKKCKMQDNVMHCPVIQNKDSSSTFVPFDIRILDQIAPNVIECQKGFIQ